jgi:hypothetical protein
LSRQHLRIFAQVSVSARDVTPNGSTMKLLRRVNGEPRLVTTDGKKSLLDSDDARFFLTRIGFAPDSAELAQCEGLTRAQAVDKALANARSQAISPPPAWLFGAIPTLAERNAWTPDQRREQ